jgi:uncharacterized membrane protein (DUF4010 family)
MSELELLAMFSKSLGIGLLIGLEREGHKGAKAGLRTFALIALSGTLFALLGEKTAAPWLLGVVAVVIGAMLVAAYANECAAEDSDPGTTTIISALVTFGLGASLWYGYSELAVALAIVTTALLYFRTELHGVTRQLSRRDYVSFLQFAVLAFILLPILPDRTWDPFGAINPYRIGLLVLLISGVSLAGYAALRIFGERQGSLLAGIFGGMTSTTATTTAFSRHTRHEPAIAMLSARIILIANLVLYLRIGAFIVVLAPSLLTLLGPVFVGGLLAGVGFTLWHRRLYENGIRNAPHVDISNPAELRMALGFAALFTAILFVVSWLNETLGMAGVYAAAFLAGLTDLDAISLSTLRLLNTDKASAPEAALAIVIAFVANLIFKLAITAFAGSRPLARVVGGGFAAMCVGMAAGWGVYALIG